MALGPTSRTGLPDHEELLLDYAERLRRHLQGRRAIHLHLSKLRSQNQRDHYLRIAANSFANLVNDHEGQLFRMQNNDLVVIVKNASVTQIDEVVLRIKYLFGDDPLIDADGEDNVEFGTWYDLEREYDRFHGDVRALHRAYLERAGRQKTKPQTNEDVDVGPRQPLDPKHLGQMIDVISTSDLTSLLRRQTVCAILPGEPARPVFNEIFVSIDTLRKRVMPEIDLYADPWLFQHLTQVLDRRLLRALPDAERSVELPASVNINVATILSDDFASFERQFRIMTQKTLLFEFQCIDVFADLASFIFARDYLHGRGYRVCLDGLDHRTFPLIRRDELGVDMEKIYWDVNAREEILGDKSASFRDAVRATGAARVVLCRCDDSDALDFGHAHGITLFQGRYVESLLSAAGRA